LCDNFFLKKSSQKVTGSLCQRRAPNGSLNAFSLCFLNGQLILLASRASYYQLDPVVCNSQLISYNFMRSHWCRTTDSNIKLFFKRGRKAHRGKGSKWVVPSAFWTPAWLSFLTSILLWVHTFCAIRHWSLTIL
jgi:hypothetical protein